MGTRCYSMSRSHGLLFPFKSSVLTMGCLPVQNFKKESENFIVLNAKLVQDRKPNL